MVQMHELAQYQMAAETVCRRMGVDPWDFITTFVGPAPRWVEYAVRMHEMRLMAEAMHSFGIPMYS